MSRRFDELLLQRGRLIERIASQRTTLQQNFSPIVTALNRTDFAVAKAHSFVISIRRHPWVLSLVVVALLATKGKTVLRWSGRAFSLWRTWRLARETLQNLNLWKPVR